MKHVTHTIDVPASPDRVYQIIADVTQWPVCFPPTVHAERVSGTERAERIRIWAVANDSLRTWESDRKLDPVARTVAFEQTRTSPPVAVMRGLWRIEPRGDGSAVTLEHTYAASSADGLPAIDAAVDRNSRSELDALSRAITMEPLVFDDTEVIPGSVDQVYAFVNECDQWPHRLPHVSRVDLTEETPGLQLMEMDTRSPDGSVHTSRSWRVCSPSSKITYKQVKAPGIMSVHNGEWTFRPVPGGSVRATSRHTVVIDREKLAAMGDKAPPDPAQAVRDALGANSRATLRAAKDYLERTER